MNIYFRSINSIEPLREVERQIIVEAVQNWPNMKPLIAERLGISLKTLYNKMNRYGLDTKTGEPIAVIPPSDTRPEGG